jgi:hypothetical protein
MIRPLIFFMLLNVQHATSHKPKFEKKVFEFDYPEYIRQKLNGILEINEGNYWDFKYRVIDKENKLKEYLR